MYLAEARAELCAELRAELRVELRAESPVIFLDWSGVDLTPKSTPEPFCTS